MTNREMINNMTDHELAMFVRNKFLWWCGDCEIKECCKSYDRNGGDCVLAIEKWCSENAF